jgi:hypothetical protein
MKEDLRKDPENEIIINAIISHYQIKLELMDEIITRIENYRHFTFVRTAVKRVWTSQMQIKMKKFSKIQAIVFGLICMISGNYAFAKGNQGMKSYNEGIPCGRSDQACG